MILRDGANALRETDAGSSFLAALRSPFELTFPSCRNRWQKEGSRWRTVWYNLPGVGMAGYTEHRDGFREIRVFQGGN